ncbi:MAG: hypothetical protein WKF83_09815 [Nocardioidaceae bacterium]
MRKPLDPVPVLGLGIGAHDRKPHVGRRVERHQLRRQRGRELPPDVPVAEHAHHSELAQIDSHGLVAQDRVSAPQRHRFAEADGIELVEWAGVRLKDQCRGDRLVAHTDAQAQLVIV